MNWLIYIGGGVLWFTVWSVFINETSLKIKHKISFIANVMITWIWICWRFIA